MQLRSLNSVLWSGCLVLTQLIVLHTGGLGAASVLKVVANYLVTANILTLCEALATSKVAGMNMNIVYEVIRIS